MKQKHSLTYRILTGFTPRSKCHQLLQAILNTLWLEVCSYSPFPHYFLLYCSKFVTALLNSLGSDFGFIQVELKSDLACCIWICGWFKHLSGEQMLTLFSNLNYHKLEPKWCNDIGEVIRWGREKDVSWKCPSTFQTFQSPHHCQCCWNVMLEEPSSPANELKVGPV